MKNNLSIYLIALALGCSGSLSSYAETSECCQDVSSKDSKSNKVSKDAKGDVSPIYLRTDLLAHKFHKARMAGVTYKNQNYSYGLDVGLGYRVMDRVRAELVGNYNFMTRFKANSDNVIYKGKANARALFLRGMVDVISFDSYQIFVGAGAGLARVNNKMHLNQASSNGGKFEAKTSTNFAYSFHAGAAMNVADGVIFEASWGMRNYGTTGHLVDYHTGQKLKGSKLKLKSQFVSLGLRFDV